MIFRLLKKIALVVAVIMALFAFLFWMDSRSEEKLTYLARGTYFSSDYNQRMLINSENNKVMIVEKTHVGYEVVLEGILLKEDEVYYIETEEKKLILAQEGYSFYVSLEQEKEIQVVQFKKDSEAIIMTGCIDEEKCNSMFE